MIHFWPILTGILVASCCAVLGCYLVLRKMSMVGDAISHAVLPGIVIVFMLTESYDSFAMLIGASLVGIFTTFLIEFFHRKARLQSDAAIGITFTWMFAIGVILLTRFTTNAHLDQECVLYGEITMVAWEVKFLGVPRTVWLLGSVLVLNLAFVLIGYKELFLTTFDPAFAAAVGISTALWHYLLMGMVSLTTVASFNSVGAILVVAFLVAPAATAYLLTNKLPVMLLIAVGAGILSALGGYLLASWLGSSVSGAMATVAGFEFLLALLFSPLQGVIPRWFRRGKTKPGGPDTAFVPQDGKA